MRNTNLIPTWCPHPSAPQEALQYLIPKLRFQAEFGLSAYYLSRVIGKGQKKVKSTKCKVKTELSKQIPQVLSSSRPPDSASVSVLALILYFLRPKLSGCHGLSLCWMVTAPLVANSQGKCLQQTASATNVH